MDKYCIVTAQRSGSAWLVSLLDSHPEIEAFYELFLIGPDKNKRLDQFHTYRSNHKKSRPAVTFDYLDQLNHYPGRHKSIGFKIMYNQLARFPEVMATLVLERYKIIHLIRENHLDRLISSASMDQNGLIHSTKDVKANPVILETDSLARRLSWQENQVKAAKLLLKLMPNPVLQISYDNLIQDQNQTLAKVINFLGDFPPEATLSSDRKKINSGSYQDKIYNYNHVCETLSGTRFEKYLEPDRIESRELA